MSQDLTIRCEESNSRLLNEVQSLSDLLAKATAAIAQNKLADLEKCIAWQQAACASVLSREKDFQVLLKDARTRHEFAKALETLNRENQSYSRLLATSSASVRVMLALCNSYTDSVAQSAGLQQETRGMSCEA